MELGPWEQSWGQWELGCNGGKAWPAPASIKLQWVPSR